MLFISFENDLQLIDNSFVVSSEKGTDKNIS